MPPPASDADSSLSKDELDAGLQSLLAPPADTLAFAQSRNTGTRDAERFSQADSDSSGGIDASEPKAAMEASPRSAGKPVDQDQVNAPFSKLDSDSSGDISAAEMAAGKPGRGAADAATAASGQAGPPPGAGGPPPGGSPGGAQGADGDSDDSSKSSSTSSSAAIDPLDTNSDGSVSASERAAGQTQAVLKQLLAAADSNGDQQISSSEAKRFGALLSQMVASAAAAGGAQPGNTSDTSADRSDRSGLSDRQSRRADNPGFADQVLRHYARTSATADTASSFSASA